MTEIEECSKSKNEIEEVIGLDEVKKILKSRLHIYYKYKDKYIEYDIPPLRGLVLHGKPGVGKSLVVKNTIKNIDNSDLVYCEVKSSELMSGKVGESASLIEAYFEKLRLSKKDVILFIDEIEAIVPKRDKTQSVLTRERVTSLLKEIDNSPTIYIIGATNLIDEVDTAILRSARIDDTIEVPIPNEEDRLKLLKKYLEKIPLSSDVNLNELAKDTIGYTGADFYNLRTKLFDLYIERLDNGDSDTTIHQDDIEEQISSIHKPDLPETSTQELQIVQLLERHPDGLYSGEIAEILKLQKSHTSRALSKLKRMKRVKMEKEKTKRKYFLLRA